MKIPKREENLTRVEKFGGVNAKTPPSTLSCIPFGAGVVVRTSPLMLMLERKSQEKGGDVVFADVPIAIITPPVTQQDRALLSLSGRSEFESRQGGIFYPVNGESGLASCLQEGLNSLLFLKLSGCVSG